MNQILIVFGINLVMIFQFILFLSVIFSWFPSSMGHPFVQFIRKITTPVLRPIQRILPRTGMMDFAPLVAFLLCIFLEAFFRGLL